MIGEDGGTTSGAEFLLEGTTAEPPIAGAAESMNQESGNPEGPSLSIVSLVSIDVDLPSTNPTIILREAEDPWREVRITVGLSDAVEISRAWRRMPAVRPPTHFSWAETLRAFKIEIESLVILDESEGVFRAELALSCGGKRQVFDVRPTDGISLVLRQPAAVPILMPRALIARIAT